MNSLVEIREIIKRSGRGATFFVAASNASARSRAQADYICDGTADDVQIQAAINALPAGVGGVVQLSEGTFNISATLVMANSVYLRGMGNGLAGAGTTGTRLYLVNGANTTMFLWQIAGADSSMHFGGLVDMHLVGNKANQAGTSHAIFINNNTGGANSIGDLVFENIYAEQFLTDLVRIAAPGSWRTWLHTFRNCWLEDCNEYSVYLDGSGSMVNGIKFENCNIGYGVNSIRILGPNLNDIVFTGCHIFDSTQHNVYLLGAKRVSFVGCNIMDGGSDGADLYDGVFSAPSGANRNEQIIFQGCQIENRVINNRQRIGLNLDDCDHCIIEGNVIIGHGQGAIILKSSNYNIVKDNQIKDNCQTANNTYDEISIENDGVNYSTYNLIKDNFIRETAANKARYGIAEANASDDFNSISGNEVIGAVTGRTNLLGFNDRIDPAAASLGKTGDYIVLPTTVRQATQTSLGVDTIWYVPVFLDTPLSIDRLALRVIVGVALGKIRVGIYTDVNGRPGVLVVDSGELDATANAEREGVIATTLGARRFWLAFLCNNVTIEIASTNDGKAVPWTDAASSRDSLTLTVAQAYGALPASAPAPTGVQNRALLVSVRLA